MEGLGNNAMQIVWCVGKNELSDLDAAELRPYLMHTNALKDCAGAYQSGVGIIPY